jgi:indolepyruvate ferredoxin oxidoreductase, beta subunit
MIKEFNIIIAGVGGQGVVLMSELLGDAAVKDGLNVKGSEILGMAVRGGSVFSTIRMGKNVLAPLTPIGRCNILVAMEPTEALRNMYYLSKNSLIIMNRKKVMPFTVALGLSKYPELATILENLKQHSKNIIQLDADRIAVDAGSIQTANIVMLGALFGTGQLPIKVETIKDVIMSRFSAKLAPVNLKAFELGYTINNQTKQEQSFASSAH